MNKEVFFFFSSKWSISTLSEVDLYSHFFFNIGEKHVTASAKSCSETQIKGKEGNGKEGKSLSLSDSAFNSSPHLVIVHPITLSNLSSTLYLC